MSYSLRRYSGVLILGACSFAMALGAQTNQETALGSESTFTFGGSSNECLSKRDLASLQLAYQGQRHRVRKSPTGHRAQNPEQQLQVEFDGHGFLLRPDDGDWSWGLALESIGMGTSLAALAAEPMAEAQGGRMSYRWSDDLEEWYINDERGIEHGYTLKRRPASAGEAGQATLDLSLQVLGGLQPKLSADKRALWFYDAEGKSRVTYSGLTVFDADHEPLGAYFELDGTRVMLRIEEGGARYPLTIDPVVQQAYLKSSNSETGDLFGRSVSISGNRAVIGAPGEDSSALGVDGDQTDNGDLTSGAAYVFLKTSSGWVQEAYLKSFFAGAVSSFGRRVVIDGDRVFVGGTARFSGFGGVFEYVRDASGWRKGRFLVAPNSYTGLNFGESLALAGSHLVVGASNEDSGSRGVNGIQFDISAPDSGAVYVYDVSGPRLILEAYLKASNSDAGDFFGDSVSISGDTLVVGAPREASSSAGPDSDQSSNGSVFAGAAYVFVFDANGWRQESYLKASNPDVADGFGNSVSVSGDTIVAGAPREASSARGVDGDQNSNEAGFSGAAYVFVRQAGVWTQEAYLKASNTRPSGNGTAAWFGGATAIDADRILIGARLEISASYGVDGPEAKRSKPPVNSGAVYAFVRSQGQWTQQAFLKGPANGADDFGGSVAISGDLALVGAEREASDATGVNGDWDNNLAWNSGAGVIFDMAAASGVSRYGNYTGSNAGDIYSFSEALPLDMLQLRLTRFRGTGSALIFLSSGRASVPFAGGLVLIDLSARAVPPVSVPLFLGTGTLSARIPLSAAGMTFYAQAARSDSTQPAGVILSTGLKIEVGL